MKRALIPVVFLVASAAFGGEVLMNVTKNGVTIGSAKYFITVLPKRAGLRSTFSMTMDSEEGQVQFLASGIYDRFGRPKSETFRRSAPKLSQTMEVKYFRQYLVCSTVKNGEKSSLKISYPKKCDLTSPSLFWFLTIKPKPGTKEIRQQFDSDLMKIITRKVTYVKPETIVLNNKPMQGYRIDHKDGVFWMDKSGMPLEMDLGEVKLLRR